MEQPEKHASVATRLAPLRITGVSTDDRYLAGIGENFEPHYAAFAAAFLRPDSRVLDIGANIGMTAAIMSPCVPEGTVWAFEPGPAVYRQLVANCERNDLHNVRPHQFAISDTEGSVGFDEDSAYGHLAERGSTLVAARTVDSLVTELGIDRVDVMKIDVEGFEWGVLRGAAEVLQRDQPLVHMEFNSFCQLAYGGINPTDLLKWLFTQFSHVFVVSRKPTGPLLTRVTPSDVTTLLHLNLVDHGCVSDLVLTNREERLMVNLVGVQERITVAETERVEAQRALVASQAENTRLRAELDRYEAELTAMRGAADAARAAADAASAEADAARAEVAEVYGSTSWKASQPVRSLLDRRRAPHG